MKVSFVNETQFLDILNRQLFDPSFEGVVHVSGSILAVDSKRTNGRILKRILNEHLFSISLGLGMIRNNIYFNIIDKKIQQLLTGGLIGFYVDKYHIWEKPKMYERYRHLFEHDGPKVLSLTDLEAGFVIWLVVLSFSLVAFILEWIARLRDFIVVMFVLNAFFEEKQIIMRQNSETIFFKENSVVDSDEPEAESVEKDTESMISETDSTESIIQSIIAERLAVVEVYE